MDRFFATASRGTEQVLAEELRAIGIRRVELRRAGVEFGACLEDAYRACLWSTVASRVLLPLAEFEVDGAEALYEGVHAIDWTSHLGPERTLAVDVAGGNSPAGAPQFVVLKAKDAIVDHVRSAEGARPDIDTARPDVRVNLHLAGTRVTVSLDLAGRSLHRRGIQRSGEQAPLKENLAAALLRIAGWPAPGEPVSLYDPFCGSGTILIEAAWMALDVACGLARERIGAESWRGHDRAAWKRLREEAEQRRAAGSATAVRIAGSDASSSVIRTARENLKRAGVARHVSVETRDLREAAPPWDDAGIVVTNPPYGARLGEASELGSLYELLGDTLKRRFPGWKTWVLCGAPALGKRIGLRPASRRILHNGPIECRLLEIPISAAPVEGERGPGWRRPSAQAGSFAKRLRKNRRELGRWVEREDLTCYRVYDADVPEYNLSVDWYNGAVLVGENPRPRKIAEAEAERRLRDALLVVPEVLEVDPSDVVLRGGASGAGRPGRDDERRFREVREGELRFHVDLTLYPDAGLALDQRLLRHRIRERVSNREFLDLFARTCSATTAAAVGGARSTTSLDPSNALLAWGSRNLALNGIAPSRHRFQRADVLQWLSRTDERQRFDLIHVAPPTYARSRTQGRDFDLQKDHAWLLSRCAALLARDGEILFSTELRRFELASLPGLHAREITGEVTPPDFARRPLRRVWVVRQGAAL